MLLHESLDYICPYDPCEEKKYTNARQKRKSSVQNGLRCEHMNDTKPNTIIGLNWRVEPQRRMGRGWEKKNTTKLWWINMMEIDWWYMVINHVSHSMHSFHLCTAPSLNIDFFLAQMWFKSIYLFFYFVAVPFVEILTWRKTFPPRAQHHHHSSITETPIFGAFVTNTVFTIHHKTIKIQTAQLI